jgi:hypothetical protein
MIKIKNLTVRNFMSVGNQTQAVDFDKGQLTLVLGENMDLGGDDSGARNGTGKTTIINGLSYAIYGNALAPATTIDAFITAPLRGKLSLIARGENLTDEPIITRNQGGSIDLGVPRTLWLGVRYGF